MQRVTKFGAALAALAVLAGGRAALASVVGKDRSTALLAEARAHHGRHATRETPAEPDTEAASESADIDKVERSDRTTADVVDATQDEEHTESAPDGPGGHSDPVPNASTEQDGEH
jgi:hypothetical protein